MLAAVDIENFRCIRSASLELHPEGTGIVGANASGKTTLLEAIYFLGHGRSFRSNNRDQLIGPGSDRLRVVGQARTQLDRSVVVGAEFGHGRTTARIDGSRASSLSEIASVLPIGVIDPSVHRLIEEGSVRRRRLLDWGVFHVEHGFMIPWRRYQRALVQRNAVLRKDNTSEATRVWENELVVAGGEVDSMRAHYWGKLAPHFEQLAGQLLDVSATADYRRGWAADQDLSESLAQSRGRDNKLRTTTVGPHRADLAFKVEGLPARERVSRGQQKMLAAAFILAQIRLQIEIGAEPVCLLVDDPAAELDVDNLGKILGVVNNLRAQLVVTSVTETGLGTSRIGRKFHVEQGRFTRML
jgi:DNA replication and repair protein RecF